MAKSTLEANTDEQLVARTAGADSAALGELYERHGRAAWAIAFRVLRDHALAEDAVQEAFLQLWRGADRYDAKLAKPGTWICVLAHRRAVDLARREARRRLTDPTVPQPDPASYSAEELVLAQLERRDVQRALGLLSDDQRRLVELAYYGGLTQVELAERLGVPLGTIKSRMFHALAQLRRSYAPPQAA